jgi:hypothetical protein
MSSGQSERERELEGAPLRKPDKATWPRGVRPISIEEVDGIGVDVNGDLYWHGKRVETRTRVDLNWRQITYGAIILIATIVAACGALAQGWAAYNEWACKVGWRAVACPPELFPSLGSGGAKVGDDASKGEKDHYR